jgi:lipopolysaccharide/colanic/teichoic acid biosynthesis glycosyltransferase
MDLVVSFFVAVVFLPVFPFIALAIKIDTRGPVFVKCERLSNGKKIKAYKFRSMIFGAEKMKDSLQHLNDRKDGPFFKIKKDPRVTRVGRVLRGTLIDEIPQIINVFKGEMAIVGPRPHEPREVEKYPEKYKHLPNFRAGITGISQISGASSLNWEEELELDASYVGDISFKNDFKIILKTIVLFFSEPNGV